ncbi:hypothetical protein GJ744_008539 [Endocarpon pusillum]|uniref:Biotrophy-associated secreted protein 2 n=1 Tax=Endocarpon pusillum TaxID=364733 RepID=A0A8H7AH22_9EURO|nr:hypothetical protein GJ744_008539 [Endocarpon pusillum]
MASFILKNSAIAFLAMNLAFMVAAQGTQFITGVCKSDADCASGCCGFKTGKCAGAIVAQGRDGGCGFGDAQPNDKAAKALGFQGTSPANGGGAAAPAGGAAAPATSSAAPAAGAAAGGSGKAPGTQFITGACANDAECASGCCGFKTGKCAGAIVAQGRDGGCGFGDAQPNDKAAKALGFQGTSPANGGGAAAPAAPAAPANSSAVPAAGAAAGGSGKAPGTQFITGACANDAECASGCCGFKTGKCAGAIVAQGRDGGCGFGDAQPNDTAAKALRGQ